MGNGRLEYSFYYQNVRGLGSKANTFFLNVMANDFDIKAITGTYLQRSINLSNSSEDILSDRIYNLQVNIDNVSFE